jgi:hypothetical protein
MLLPCACCCCCFCSIEPDGQRPKVLLHGKACRKTSDPKCSYEASGEGTQPARQTADYAQVKYTAQTLSEMRSPTRSRQVHTIPPGALHVA